MNRHETPAVPRTVAIIMDGNRRYEKRMGLPEGRGHELGLGNARIIARAVKEYGAEQLSLWGGSKSNLKKRGLKEVSGLFRLLRSELQHQMRSREKVRFRLCGELSEFTADRTILELVQYVEKKTAENEGYDLTALFGYSGKDELIAMVRSVVASGARAEDINAELIQKHLWTSHLRDVELLIRTGVDATIDPEGDEHWSDPFLPWQINQTRIIWSRKLWPEFNELDLGEAFERFALCRAKQRMGV